MCVRGIYNTAMVMQVDLLLGALHSVGFRNVTAGFRRVLHRHVEMTTWQCADMQS